MAWFTVADGYIDNAITTAVRQKVAPTTASFNDAELLARKRVQAAYLHSGYSLDNDSPTDLAKSIAKALWIIERYGSHAGMSVPQQWLDVASILNGIWSGEYPDPDSDPNTRDGIGGVKFSSTSETSTSGRPSRLSRSELDTW